MKNGALPPLPHTSSWYDLIHMLVATKFHGVMAQKAAVTVMGLLPFFLIFVRQKLQSI